MRVGLISDIHANLPALEAVLEELPPVDTLVCAGDIVGYNPWPAACVERVREAADIVVMGNHDRNVRTPARYRANRMAMAGLELAKEELSAEQLDWLDALPRREEFDEAFLVVHDHPEHQDSYVRPEQFRTIPEFLDGHRGVVLGHTHVQHAESVQGALVVNPGSVGQPRDGDPDAAYAVLEPAEPSVELHRTSYDIDAVISRIEELGLPRRTGTRLPDGA
jgi:putative phosphoesterase